MQEAATILMRYPESKTGECAVTATGIDMQNKNKTIRLTKQFRFEMAHALHHYDGPCRNIHGHSYVLDVTVSGKQGHPEAPEGMVMDFKKLKKLVKENLTERFDHALILNREAASVMQEPLTAMRFKVQFVPFEPTAENLLDYFVAILNSTLPEHISVEHLKLQETDTSWAEYYASDQERTKEEKDYEFSKGRHN